MGFKILVFSHFQKLFLLMKILKRCLAVRGGSSEPSVLTARSVGLTSSSMAQVRISLEKKMSSQQVLLYLRAATSIAEVGGGGLRGKSSILTLTHEKERFQDLAAKKKKLNRTPNPKRRKKIKTCVKNCVNRHRHIVFRFYHPGN